ncbi:MAG: hypothetical protein KGL39_02755 [Patescibacteria group bacterium]|nr:hypothetical protein [Patescibacteria group bacterium]
MGLPLTSREFTLVELATSLGRTITDVHRKPSKNGMVTWCRLDGFLVETATARERLERQYNMRERQSKR